MVKMNGVLAAEIGKSDNKRGFCVFNVVFQIVSNRKSIMGSEVNFDA